MPAGNSIFINLPAKSIDAAERFARALGFVKKGKCGPDSTWFSWGDQMSLFYHEPKTFGSFCAPGSKVHTYDPPGAPATTEVIITLTAETKGGVDEMIASGIEAGGTMGPIMVPEEEQGRCNMYSRSVIDPDGHLFEIIYHSKMS